MSTAALAKELALGALGFAGVPVPPLEIAWLVLVPLWVWLRFSGWFGCVEYSLPPTAIRHRWFALWGVSALLLTAMGVWGVVGAAGSDVRDDSAAQSVLFAAAAARWFARGFALVTPLMYACHMSASVWWALWSTCGGVLWGGVGLAAVFGAGPLAAWTSGFIVRVVECVGLMAVLGFGSGYVRPAAIVFAAYSTPLILCEAIVLAITAFGSLNDGPGAIIAIVALQLTSFLWMAGTVGGLVAESTYWYGLEVEGGMEGGGDDGLMDEELGYGSFNPAAARSEKGSDGEGSEGSGASRTIVPGIPSSLSSKSSHSTVDGSSSRRRGGGAVEEKEEDERRGERGGERRSEEDGIVVGVGKVLGGVLGGAWGLPGMRTDLLAAGRIGRGLCMWRDVARATMLRPGEQSATALARELLKIARRQEHGRELQLDPEEALTLFSPLPLRLGVPNGPPSFFDRLDLSSSAKVRAAVQSAGAAARQAQNWMDRASEGLDIPGGEEMVKTVDLAAKLGVRLLRPRDVKMGALVHFGTDVAIIRAIVGLEPAVVRVFGTVGFSRSHETLEIAQRELRAASELDHQGTVRLLGLLPCPPDIALCYERFPRGSLADLIGEARAAVETLALSANPSPSAPASPAFRFPQSAASKALRLGAMRAAAAQAKLERTMSRSEAGNDAWDGQFGVVWHPDEGVSIAAAGLSDRDVEELAAATPKGHKDRERTLDALRTVVVLDWPRRLRMAADVASTLSYLHTAFAEPLIHRDIKPDNVFVRADLSVAVGDFGDMRERASAGGAMTAGRGTLSYQAPEMFSAGRRTRYSEKVDIFSLGVVLWEICGGREPLEALLEAARAENARREALPPSDPLHTATVPIPDGAAVRPETIVTLLGDFGIRPPPPPHTPPPVAALLQAMWHSDPDQRPSGAHIADTLYDLAQEAHTALYNAYSKE